MKCFQCCRAMVMSTESEGMAFADFLLKCRPDSVEHYMELFEAWWEKAVDTEVHEEMSTPVEFHAKKLWCPVMSEGTCSQYAMRPIVCRTHHSINVADCDEWRTSDEGLEALYTDDLLSRSVTEIGMGQATDVSYWQFWVGKHLGCSFSDEKPPLLGDD